MEHQQKNTAGGGGRGEGGGGNQERLQLVEWVGGGGGSSQCMQGDSLVVEYRNSPTNPSWVVTIIETHTRISCCRRAEECPQ